MTTSDLVSYVLAHIKSAGYVKGPVYVYGVQCFGAPTIEQLRKQIAQHDQHEIVLHNFRSQDGSSLTGDDFIYAYHHLDHPEAQQWPCYNRADHWNRPSAEQVATESKTRIATINRWNEVMEELLVRAMNPHKLSIRPVEWERAKYYPQYLSDKTVYEANGNWPNSHGMYLTTAGWMDQARLDMNKHFGPASAL